MVEEVRKAIEKEKSKFVEGLRKGDATVIASEFTEDAILLPQDSEMIRGKKEIEKFYGSLIQMGFKDTILTTVELFGSGDIVHEVGRQTAIKQREQKSVKVEYKYVAIYKHDPSGWKVHRLIWNTNTPPQK